VIKFIIGIYAVPKPEEHVLQTFCGT